MSLYYFIRFPVTKFLFHLFKVSISSNITASLIPQSLVFITFLTKKMIHSAWLKEPQFLFNTVKEKKRQAQDFDLVNNYFYDQTKKK